jgi:protein-tyrosine sulfotransferase
MRSIRKIKSLIGKMLGLSGLDEHGFDLDIPALKISEHALRVAKAIRGEGRPPAIIIHGVMPRSGTVYTGELLRLHPALHAYPNDIWEIPFLELTGDALRMQKRFFMAYKQNKDKVGDHDFLPLFGAALIAYLYSFIPEGKRMLLKVPDVQYLQHFYAVFPYENPLLLMRDGRDVVNSTINSWPDRRFDEVCSLWDRSARMMLAFEGRYSRNSYPYLSVKYEDVVKDPDGFAKRACDIYGLDYGAYPGEKIKELPVRGSSSTVGKAGAQTAWNPVDKPKNFNPVGRWNDWPENRKGTFKRVAGQTLMNTGYCASLDW